MKIYTVHHPADDPATIAEESERVEFVREGFSWLALLLPLVWFLAHRMWLVSLIYVVGMVALNLLLLITAPDDFVLWTMVIAIHVMIGYLANDLRRWTLARRGFRTLAVVMADTALKAEHRFFSALAGGDLPGGETMPSMRHGSTLPELRPSMLSGRDESFELFPAPGTGR